MIVVRRKRDGRYIRRFDTKKGMHKTVYSKYAAKQYTTAGMAISALNRMGVDMAGYELVDVSPRCQEDV